MGRAEAHQKAFSVVPDVSRGGGERVCELLGLAGELPVLGPHYGLCRKVNPDPISEPGAIWGGRADFLVA